MKFIQAVPDHSYFVWQLYIQMQNFREMGVEDQSIILVGITGEPSEAMKSFEQSTTAQVLYYQDSRKSRYYPPSIRPHLMAHYFRAHETQEAYFYHDQDIIFLDAPTLDRLEEGNMCYAAAGAKPYLEIKSYLSKFKRYLIPCMCEIIDIDQDIVEANDPYVGGAQYVLKGMTAQFWEKCEDDSEGLYRFLLDQNTQGLRRYNPHQSLEHNEVQAWTADMWVVLWNLWRIGYKVEQAPEIDFCWPTDTWENKKPIMHNAGVGMENETDGRGNFVFFNKARYATRNPFQDRFDYVPAKYLQSSYVQYIHRIAEYNIAI